MVSVSDERCLLTLSIEGNLSIALSPSPFMHLSMLRSEARSESTKTENPCKDGPWRRWRRWTRTPHSNLPGDERQQGDDDDGSLFLIPGTSGIFFSVSTHALQKSPEAACVGSGHRHPHLFPEIVGSRSSEGRRGEVVAS